MMTEAGKRLLERESMNARSFPLIDVNIIAAIEAEAVAADRARIRERVEGLLDNEWRECRGACHDVTLAAVLAILENPDD